MNLRTLSSLRPPSKSYFISYWKCWMEPTSRNHEQSVTASLWHFLTRPVNYLLLESRLLQKFLVGVYAKFETERLQYLRREQSVLRADNYK